ncbi:hypothetical protein B0H14DRAFT_3087820 [Mycena olivaceomarginata]|nr:hypothetical protein B0H14DRAFT_3087820 [Mycena olivaceomarginata]
MGRLTNTCFPPKPLSFRETQNIISRYCHSIHPSKFMERGCAVCVYLTPIRHLTPLSQYTGNFNLLVRPGVTRRERGSASDPIESDGCTDLCVDCQLFLDTGLVPKLALARHNWIGSVPNVLKDLSFAECMMIAKIRHNRCVVRVNSGRVRVSANAIMFSQPTLKVMLKLPPSKTEMNEVLAFGRTPMLVRRKKVADALNWLKLNHEGYTELEISEENLNSYAERDVPVVVDFKQTKEEVHHSVPTAARAVNESLEEQGTATGPCTFAVHGLTDKGNTLGVGRSKDPVSMYNRPDAYPGMFPRLFPSGKGGKKSLLMYHDKRFQEDTYFPMIAFNHEQMQASSLGSKLLAKRSINPEVAGNIADRMAQGERVQPQMQAEKICVDLLKDLDGAAYKGNGSITSKKSCEMKFGQQPHFSTRQRGS